MDVIRPVLLPFAFLLLGFALQSPAAPVNDNFINAIPLSGLNTNTSGSNVNATKEPGEPNHAGWTGGRSVWWIWTAPAAYTVMEVNTIGSSFDTLLGIYSGGSVTSLVTVASDDQSGGNNTSRLIFQTEPPNLPYYIAVDGFGAASGNIVLNLIAPPPPSNDAFANAILISGLTNSVTGHSTNATTEPGEPRHGNIPGNRSVWWRWTATTNWVVLVDTIGSSFAAVPYVYQGASVSNLTLVADANFSQRLTFRPQTGQTYYIAVAGRGGRIVLNLRASPAPANDAFANAAIVNGLTNLITGDNTFATRESLEPNHAGSTTGKSLWWRWTAPTNWLVALDASGSAFSTALGVYTGNTVSTLTPIASTTAGQLTFVPQTGVAYRIAVDSAFSQSGSISLNIRSVRPPTNDLFSAAARISGTSILRTGLLFGAMLENAEPTNGTDTASVWYQWTAPRRGRMTLTSDAHVRAFTGTQVSNLKLVSREVPSFSVENREVFEADAGTTYNLAITGPRAQQAPFSLRVLYAPPNDDFKAAFPLSGLSNRVQGSTIGASLEPGEPVTGNVEGHSVWWAYTAPVAGNLEFAEGGTGELPPMWVYEGTSVTSLTLLAKNHVPNTPGHLKCMFSCDVLAGRTYYIAVTSLTLAATEIETNFTFQMSLNAAPPNDAFASPLIVEPTASVTFSSTVGASREPIEPGNGSNTVWWSWTPTRPGPVVLTTCGSACDTILSVYVGNSLSSLSPVISNNDGYLWNSNNTTVSEWTTPTGPTNDVISRLRLNADNDVQYKIAISVAPTDQRPGEVTLNLTRLIIDDITAVSRTPRPDGSVDFNVNLRLANLTDIASSRLRVRLLARAGYSHDHTLKYNCPWENFTIADSALGTFSLPGSGTLPASSVTQIIVNGRCPPSAKPDPNWGYGYGVIAVLEEQLGVAWISRDARMILIGEWPQISGQSGPGAGVILVSAALQSANHVGFLDVKIGPPAAVRLGGAWRVSPTNYGELGELRPYTNYTGNNLRLAIRSTNFSIDTRPLNGFASPPNQSVVIQPAAIVPLDLAYSVNPPHLTFDPLRGLGISGVPQTAYRVEHATNLMGAAWSNYTNVTLLPGVNWLSQTTNTFSNRFYRAFWLSQ